VGLEGGKRGGSVRHRQSLSKAAGPGSRSQAASAGGGSLRIERASRLPSSLGFEVCGSYAAGFRPAAGWVRGWAGLGR
jgi:hypothetical protein